MTSLAVVNLEIASAMVIASRVDLVYLVRQRFRIVANASNFHLEPLEVPGQADNP